MDAINFVEESWNEIKSTTIEGSWKNFLPNSSEAVVPEYPAVVQEIARLAQEVEGEGFLDVQDAEILDLIMTDREDNTP